MPKSLWRSMLKIACRVRSEVGRTDMSRGETSRRPPKIPPVTRMKQLQRRVTAPPNWRIAWYRDIGQSHEASSSVSDHAVDGRAGIGARPPAQGPCPAGGRG